MTIQALVRTALIGGLITVCTSWLFGQEPPNGLSGTFGESKDPATVVPSTGAMTYGAEAIAEWGNGSMLWSLAGYHAFGLHRPKCIFPARMSGPEEYDEQTFLKFCPERATNPSEPALRWVKTGDAGWSKDSQNRDDPEYRHHNQIQSEKEIQNATTKISHRLDSAGHERQDCSTGGSLSPRPHPSFACSVAQRPRGYVGRAA